MPEILTESFCERCGTRYTFEAAAPPGKRMGKIKVLSKGLKKFVMDDDSSLDEALQEARTETDRETSSQQLDAFHQTFNFCMSCRQYTCANCWNDAVGRCLTCVPLADDFLERPFARLRPAGSPNGHTAGGAEPPRGDALAWPTTDVRPIEPEPEPEPEIVEPAAAAQPAPEPAPPLRPAQALQAAAKAAPVPPAAAKPAPTTAAKPVPEPAPPPAAEPPVKRRSGRAARSAELLAKFQPGQSLDAALEAFEATLDDEGPPEAGIRERLAAATEPAPRSQPAPRPAPKAAPPARPEPPVVAWEPELIPIDPVAVTPEPEPVAAAAEPEPQAPEAEPNWAAVTGTTPDPVAATWDEPLEAPSLDAAEADLESEWAAREAEAEWPAADFEAQGEPMAAEAEPIEAEPEPIFTEPEPAAAEPAAGQPGAAPRPTDDRVEVPTWRIVAPEPPAPRPRSPRSGPRREVPASPPASAESAVRHGSPEWPGQPATDSLAFLARRDAATGMDAVWAASTRDLLSTPPVAPAPAASTGIQGCVSCGLSLSATARFCRRCGTQQG